MSNNHSFGKQVVAFNKQLEYTGPLPEGFAVINPFVDNPETLPTMERFYHKFYGDNRTRKFIIGINPSRHGAGITGVPFTDTKRLKDVCGIEMKTAYSHEPSSVFVYDLIAQYGGIHSFYNDCYINSPFPLAIVRRNENNKWVNANYYDDKRLFDSLKPFMVSTLRNHLSLPLDNSKVFVLGKKNAAYLAKINAEERLFGELVVLEHPRFIQQYKSREKQDYLLKYLSVLAN
ncbi:SMUG2 DNA glycosylase family protein [Parapedobacter pyrenivorans]|uniref:SMUG2 DNA glycosylase family protein n=1 Tax=Parapedobacter pyrenivorans TaxID=1305674 RepID=UPI00333F0276